MTRVKCDAFSEEDDFSRDPKKVYCKFRGEDGYCTKEEIYIKNSVEGYAEACCQDEE